MVKTNHIAYGVRVKLNSNFQEKCLGDKYLKTERILFISCEKPFNDQKGEYVRVTGGSLVNGGTVYLNEIDLEFEVPNSPLYSSEENLNTDEIEATNYANSRVEKEDMYKEEWATRKSAFLVGCKFKEEQIRGKKL